MTPEEVAAATRPHLHERRNSTPWWAAAWAEHLDLVTTVLTVAGHHPPDPDQVRDITHPHPRRTPR